MTGNESNARPTEPRKSADAPSAGAVRGYADAPKGELPQVPSDFRPPALDADGEPAPPDDVPRAIREGSDDSGDVGSHDTEVDPKAVERSHGSMRRAL